MGRSLTQGELAATPWLTEPLDVEDAHCRIAASNVHPRATRPHRFAIVFSLERGHVWASWPEGGAAVDLGEVGEVLFMMRDFIAQCELGDRLAALAGAVPAESEAS